MRLLLRPSLRTWPSLARRTRSMSKARELASFKEAGSISPSDISFRSSSIALPSDVTNLRVGRLAGGDGSGRLPISPLVPAVAIAAAMAPPRAKPPNELLTALAPGFDSVFRRAFIARAPFGRTSASWMIAAMAATFVAPGLVMLLRRLTRWLALRAEPMIEWEPFLECGSRLAKPLDALVLKEPTPFGAFDIDGRWVRGLGDAWISCRVDTERYQQNCPTRPKRTFPGAR